MSIYPTAIPTNTNYPNRTDDIDWLYAARYNEIKNEVIAICAELGISPSGASATLVARLALLAEKDSPIFTTKITTPLITLTGGGITFPATAVPSTDPNTIDDYEEGTWTPVIGGATGNNYTMTQQVGEYIKTGRGIILSCLVIWSDINSASNVNLWLKGLPFALSSLSDSRHGAALGNIKKMNFDAGQLVLTGDGGQTYLIFRSIHDKADYTNIQADSNDNVAGFIQFSMSYPTN